MSLTQLGLAVLFSALAVCAAVAALVSALTPSALIVVIAVLCAGKTTSVTQNDSSEYKNPLEGDSHKFAVIKTCIVNV